MKDRIKEWGRAHELLLSLPLQQKLEQVRLTRARIEGREVSPDEIKHEALRYYFLTHPRTERQVLAFLRNYSGRKKTELSPANKACYEEFQNFFKDRLDLAPTRPTKHGERD